MKPTLKDIAAAADVSVTTVSLVLSGKGRISETVRAGVMDAAGRLGYGKKPLVAVGSKLPTVGILLNIDPQWAFVWGFIRPIIAEIERIFAEKTYKVVLFPIYEGLSEELVLNRIRSSGCAAVFSLHYGSDRIFSALESQNIPVIVIMNGNFQDRFHSILVDDFQGAYEGTMHLIKLGHQDILYVGTERINLPKLTTDRYYGFRKALEEAGLPADPQRCLNCEASNTQFLEASLKSLFTAARRPTAVFAIDDDMAIRIAALLKPLGLRIPEDLSIIAPGDLLNYADPFVVPISTLRIDTKLMGKLACDMMLRRLSGDDEGVHVIKVKQQLVQRGSTRPQGSARTRSAGRRMGASKERFLATFERRRGPAVCRWLGASREFIAKACVELNLDEDQFRLRIGDDFRWIDLDAIGQGGRRVDPFGIERQGSGYGQPTSHPLRNDPTIKSLQEYPWPDPEQEDTSWIREKADPIADHFAIVGGSWSPFWHDAVDLMGLETLACLMYDDPVFVETLLHRIVDYYVALNTRIFEEAGDLIDLLFIRNDFGTQMGPLISADHFDRFISPCVARLTDTAHRYGIKVMLHSSGGIRPLLPSIVSTGVDALHALQPDCPGMQGSAIKKEVGGRIILSGGIDARGLLLHGSPQEVRRNVLSTLSSLAVGGGYLAAPSVDAITEDIPVRNVLAMFDAISEWRDS